MSVAILEVVGLIFVIICMTKALRPHTEPIGDLLIRGMLWLLVLGILGGLGLVCLYGARDLVQFLIRP